jgi:hypothetical protein
VRLTLWEFNLKILHCINDWNDGYQLYHSSRFFSFLFFFKLIQITQGNLRFFSLQQRGWWWRRYCILAPPDICLSSKTIKYVLIVMRGFSPFFFFFYFLRICIKNSASHERETFSQKNKCAHKKEWTNPITIFFPTYSLLFFLCDSFYPLRFKKLKFFFQRIKKNGIRLKSN